MIEFAAAAIVVLFFYALREAYCAGARSKPDPHALLIDDTALRIRMDSGKTLIAPDPDGKLRDYLIERPSIQPGAAWMFTGVST